MLISQPPHNTATIGNQIMLKLFESHCHLDDPVFDDDIDQVIRRATESGIAGVMIAGVNEASSRKAISIAKSAAGIYASVGIHPHDVISCSEAVLCKLVQLSAHPKVRAWGEIGLDYNRMLSPETVQEKWFVRQLETARSLDLPVIFHERDSRGRLLELLRARSRNLEGVVHCFSGTEAELAGYLDLGLYIGITGIITLASRGRKLRQMAPIIPADRLLVETDSPYLTPTPERNRISRNEPAFVRRVLLKLAEVRGEDPEYLSSVIWANSCELFRISGTDVAINR